MKKMIIMALLFSMILLVAGCSQSMFGKLKSSGNVTVTQDDNYSQMEKEMEGHMGEIGPGMNGSVEKMHEDMEDIHNDMEEMHEQVEKDTEVFDADMKDDMEKKMEDVNAGKDMGGMMQDLDAMEDNVADAEDTGEQVVVR